MKSTPDRLLLDEMFSPQIAVLLAEDGIDCGSVAADPSLRTSDDTAVADAALAQRRVLVTNNVVDFERIRRQRLAREQPMPELIYTDDRAFPRNRDWVRHVAAALEHAAAHHLTKQHGGVLWLDTPPSV